MVAKFTMLHDLVITIKILIEEISEVDTALVVGGMMGLMMIINPGKRERKVRRRKRGGKNPRQGRRRRKDEEDVHLQPTLTMNQKTHISEISEGIQSLYFCAVQ